MEKELLEFINNNDKWIIDGNWRQCLDIRLQYANTVIYLDYKLDVYKKGVIDRYNKYKGKHRLDIPQCIEKLDSDFLSNVENYEETRGVVWKDRLKNFDKNINVLIFKSREEVEKFINEHLRT